MFIAQGIANLLSWLYDLWPSYIGAIVLLTLIVMVVMAPLTVRQTRSMLEMQRLQPELKRLRDTHGDDRERLNQEMMALYQANSVNPLGGCLPLLLQLPIFLFLFRVVRGLTRRITTIGLATGAAAGSAPRSAIDMWVLPPREFNPDFISTTSRLAQDLRASNEMRSLGIDLSDSAASAVHDSFGHALPYLLLVAGIAVTTWIQQRQIRARTSATNLNPHQQAIMRIVPFLLPVFSFGFPAALLIYWLVSNMFRVGQQYFITHKVYAPHDAEAAIIVPDPPEGAKPPDRSNGRGAPNKPKATRPGAHGSRNPVSGRRPPKPEPPDATT